MSTLARTNLFTRLVDRYWEIWSEVLGLIGSWANMLFDVMVWYCVTSSPRFRRFTRARADYFVAHTTTDTTASIGRYRYRSARGETSLALVGIRTFASLTSRGH